MWVGSFEPTFSCLKGSSLNCIKTFVLTNSYGHPHEATLRRLQAAGAKMLRTDELGQIRISIDKKQLLAETGYRRVNELAVPRRSSENIRENRKAGYRRVPLY